MTTPKIRTSARQAAAKQRIQQIDDPSGSAPPFERMSTTPGWIVNPGRNEERHLIETMILHLQDDPMSTMDADVLRFVYKDWPRLSSSMNTKTTVKTVKTKLLQLNVEYIYCTADNDWGFWNDYSIEGLFDIYPPTTDTASISKPAPKDTASDTSLPETPDIAMDDTPDRNDDDDSGSRASSTRKTPLRLWNPEHLQSSESESDMTAEENRKPPYKRAAQSPQESPAGSRRDKSMENISDTKRFPTVSTSDLRASHSNISSPGSSDIDDDDGFLPVPARRRHKDNRSNKQILDVQTPNVAMLLTQTQADPPIIDLLTPRSPGRPPSTSDSLTPRRSPRSERAKIATFSELLNDHIQEAMLDVDRRAQVLQETYDKYEAKLRHVDRKQTALREKEERRLEVRESLLTRWEEKMTTRARDLTNLEQRAILDLAQREQDLAMLTRRTTDVFDEHKRQVDALTFQSELAIRAWHEVEMAKFKEQLANYQQQHKARTDDFCDEQLQNLQSHLDSYAEHARGIQEKLLVRLRRDIERTYKETHAEHENPPNPINVDDVPTPEPDRSNKPPAYEASTPAAAMHPPPPDHTYDRRWANVDYNDIMHSTAAASYNTRTTDNRHHAGGPAPTGSTTKWADPEFQIAQLRKASTPTRLRGSDRKSVSVFYNSFVDFLKIYRVPIKILDDIRIDRLGDVRETLYPAELYAQDTELHERYSAAIYARLEEEDVLDPSDRLYEGLLQMYNSKRDGYTVLKALLASTLMVQNQDLGRLSTPPTAHPGATPIEFACSLKEFYQSQRQLNRSYTEREQAMMFLQGMATNPSFLLAAQQLIHDLQQISPSVPLPTRFDAENLPLTLMSHPARMPLPSTATLNVTQATYNNGRTADDNPSHSRRNSFDRSDRSRSRERRPPTTNLSTSSQRRHSSTPRPAGRPQPSQNFDLQCKACATNGHTHADCRMFPKVAAILEYITQHPSDSKDALYQYRKAHHPENRRAAREKIIKVLAGRLQHGHMDPNEDIEALAEQLTTDYWPDTEDGQNSICRLQFCTRSAVDDASLDPTFCEVLKAPPQLTSADIQQATHSIRLPDRREMDIPRTEITHGRGSPRNMTHHIAQLDTRRDLADTGASVCATGMREILHDFTPKTRYNIVGYDGVSTQAAGQGTAHIRNPTTGQIEHMYFVYVPSIRGTIVSLQHHATTHPQIHRWTQEATPGSNTGWVTFYDVTDNIVSRYQTVQDQGLYYLQDLDFVPVSSTTWKPLHHLQTAYQQSTNKVHGSSDTFDDDDCTIKTGSPSILDHVDFDHQLHIDNRIKQLCPSQESINPICTEVITGAYDLHGTIARLSTRNPMEKDVLNFETWHQRLAHCSEKRLRLTQKLVDGIPIFHSAHIPHVVNCRTCDIAKLRKAPRGPAVDSSLDLQSGQVFSMDLGFIRGPENLQQVLDRTEEAATKVIESRQGYVSYLLIIDNKSRYTWPFPLKSKSVPLSLIKTFLEIHGNHKCVDRRIRTDGEGSLAESAACRTLLLQLGYRMEKTATDSSSQNGIAERPHQTLAAMVRCLLYSSSLPITFWADALVYATYVNNRLYHSGIAGIPYTVWTGKRASVKHLRAFGSHVTVRKSGNRPTKTDPHFYDGRFLRFGATERNIVYYDTKTKRDKVARHCAVDEFHYSTPANERPHGAQTLLDKVFPNHTPPVDTPPANGTAQHTSGDYQTEDNALQVPLHTIPPFTMDTRMDSEASGTTATAAQLLTEERQQEVIHLQSSTDMYSTPTVIKIPINNLPTLGLLTSTDEHTNRVYVTGCQEGTKLSRLPRWRSMIKHSVIRSVNDHVIRSKSDLIRHINKARIHRETHVEIRFAKPAVTKLGTDTIPQLHFDQLRHINQMHIALTQMDPSDELTDRFLNFTRAALRRREDFQEWRDSEWSQHDKYLLQNMFGDPIPCPSGAVVLPFVWTYLLKEDPITTILKKKARATCNGGKKYGKAVTVAETYATCVEQPACRIYWATTASECLIAMGADAGNAFAEAPPATEVFYMRIDDQFREWFASGSRVVD